jgi:predicted rRNA methylase YqxC with S4 and FtsJ domains
MEACAAELGLVVVATCESPVLGAKGNREFLMHLERRV